MNTQIEIIVGAAQADKVIPPIRTLAERTTFVSPTQFPQQRASADFYIANPRASPNLPLARSRTPLPPRLVVPREPPRMPTRSAAAVMPALPRRPPKSSTRRWQITSLVPATLMLVPLRLRLPLLPPTAMLPWRMRLWYVRILSSSEDAANHGTVMTILYIFHMTGDKAGVPWGLV